MSRKRTLIFFVLEDGKVRPVPQRDYVRLLRGEVHLPQHANKPVRVADWYVDVRDGRPASVVNETYSVLHLDARGAIHRSRCRLGTGRNRALYEALRASAYDDPDDDPAVRKLRAQACDELTWLPNSKERSALQRLLRTA